MQRLSFLELRCFGGTGKRGSRCGAAGDCLLHRVEVAGAYETLVFHSFVAEGLLAGKFFFLQAAIGGHAVLFVIARELEHGKVQSVEARESDELEFVTHRA